MSAQDDLLAAFGEPLPPRQKQPAESVEESNAAEVAETAVAVEAHAAIPADTQTEVLTQPETVVLPAEPATQPEPAALAEPATQPEPAAQPEPVALADAAALSEAETVIAPRPGPEALSEAATVIVEHAGPDAIETQVAPQVSMPVDTPQFPPQPYLDPAAFFAQLQNESAAPAPPAQRRWPRLLLRYASALVLAGAVGVGTGYAVAAPQRTDVPFLATPSDGRHTFPAMLRPAPPAGKPAPAATDNDAQIHYGDLRQYLVAAPFGVKPTEDGWEPVKDFDATLTGTNLPEHLADQGLRRVARRGWRTPDGQHTVVELLQFPDRQAAYSMLGTLDTASQAHAGKARDVVPQLTVTSLGDLTFKAALRTFDEVDGMPGQRERRVAFESGDVVAIVTTTAPAAVPDVPTEQVVLLQAQMLR